MRFIKGVFALVFIVIASALLATLIPTLVNVGITLGLQRTDDPGLQIAMVVAIVLCSVIIIVLAQIYKVYVIAFGVMAVAFLARATGWISSQIIYSYAQDIDTIEVEKNGANEVVRHTSGTVNTTTVNPSPVIEEFLVYMAIFVIVLLGKRYHWFVKKK